MKSKSALSPRAAAPNDAEQKLNAAFDDVIEPGPNPPTVLEVAQRLLGKLTTNAEGVIDSLIHQAKNGHYQSAQLLLSEMNRIGAELKDAGDRETSERLRALVEMMEDEYRDKPTRRDETESDSEETDFAAAHVTPATM
jgi:hypothetical protein